MDAVFTWKRNSKTYFFKGDQYWRFYGGRIDYGYPKSISVWKGLPSKIDAAFKWRNGRSYFFVGGKYYRFDDWNIQVEAGFPKSIAIKWMGCAKDNVMAAIAPTNATSEGNGKESNPNVKSAGQGCPCQCSAGSTLFSSSTGILFSLLLVVAAKMNL